MDSAPPRPLLPPPGIALPLSAMQAVKLPPAEAMASGLPVVTSDYPENGTKDVVARYGNGLVVAPGAAALAAGLEAARQRWAELSQRGLAEAAHLDWDGIAAVFEAHIQA